MTYIVSLKLAINRLRLLQGKKAAIAKQQRKELSNLLSIGKDESARVRVELTIRDELECELMELLELYCELLLARFGLIESSRECDPGIAEAVCTVIYAAPKSEARELSAVFTPSCLPVPKSNDDRLPIYSCPSTDAILAWRHWRTRRIALMNAY